MANKSTTAKVERGSGDLTLHQQETDSPILPIGHIEKLQSLRPDIVDFIIAETGNEAATRRKERSAYNTRVFIERILGQLIAAGLSLAAIYAAYSTAMAGHEKASIAISTTLVIGLASTFLISRRK